ncbi:hypothetical protein AQUCO_11800036v1 [Aquilegia coerulea]|uniref:Uncharacterized protein n=1 Tax=Aquilegia coerulea TaxID=218851 RepID=A0A2G5C263_AQUCA|nr:hypothetical protein AQUCO_11800036v1 [Aquilegia coerulea]
MAKEALNRSCGELVEFSMEYFGTDELMNIAFNESRSSLRCIRLVSCYQVSEDVLVDVCKKSPLLEEIEMCHCSYTEEAIEAIGHSYVLYLEGGIFNEEAIDVANTMPSLRRLHFFGNLMNNDGLQSILNACPHLEYLDLRQCFRLDLKGDLLKKCVNKIRDLRLPNDPTDDYEFDATLDGEDIDPSVDESDYFEYGFYGF